LTFDLDVQTCPSDGPNQTHVSCEFDADPFSGSRDTLYKNKKKMQTDGTKNRTFRSSLRAVIITNK